MRLKVASVLGLSHIDEEERKSVSSHNQIESKTGLHTDICEMFSRIIIFAVYCTLISNANQKTFQVEVCWKCVDDLSVTNCSAVS